MTETFRELLIAVEADESGDLDSIIARRRPEDFEALRSLLTLDPAVKQLHRAKAIYALGRWGDPTVVQELWDILPGLDEDERTKGIDALGRLGTDDALDAILAYADDPSMPVRLFVTRALARINTPRARARLSEFERTDPSDQIRSLAARHRSPG